jgi:hypothetical protein
VSYLVNGEVFKTKAALQQRAKSILNNTVSEVSEHDLPFLIDLFRLHPDAHDKFGDGDTIKTVRVRLAMPYRTKCFEIERSDRSRTDISYIECLRPSSARNWFAAACRSAVVGQIQAFKREAFATASELTCPISGDPITIETCHVDHASPPFASIVSSFISDEGIDIRLISITDGDGEVQCLFRDPDMRSLFASYHAAHASLRVVSRRANLSLLRRSLR